VIYILVKARRRRQEMNIKCSFKLRDERGLRLFGYREWKIMFGRKRNEVTGN
jgi:hypothetical protein